MNEMQLLRGLSQVNDKYIIESDPLRKKVNWKIGISLPVVACLFILVGGVAFFKIIQFSGVEIGSEPGSKPNISISEGIANEKESGKIYFEECRSTEIGDMLGLPYEIEEQMVGKHIGYARQGEVYDYEVIAAETNVEILEYLSDTTEEFFILRKGNKYSPIIMCNTTFNNNETYKLQGEIRPQGLADIDGDVIVLPQSEVISVFGKTVGSKIHPLSVSEEELSEVITQIESAKVIDMDLAMNPNRKMYGCNLGLVLLDSNGNQIGMTLKPFDDGFIGVRICYENPEYREQEQFFFLQSDELIEIIKKHTGWRLVERSELESVTKIVFEYGGNTYQMEPDEYKKMIECIEKSTQEYVDTACPYDVEVFLYSENGEIYRGIWCNDSCGYFSLEGGIYRFTDEDAFYITEIIKKINSQIF